MTNLTKARAAHKRWRDTNKVHVRAEAKRWRERLKSYYLEYGRTYREANREALKIARALKITISQARKELTNARHRSTPRTHRTPDWRQQSFL